MTHVEAYLNKEQEEPEEYVTEDYVTEEEVIEEQPVVRKKVTGRIPRRPIPPPRPQPIQQPREYYPPVSSGPLDNYMPFSPFMYTQRQQELSAKERAKQDIMYMREMEREQLKMQRAQEARSKPSFSQKLLYVANKAAKGDRGCQRVNANLDGVYFTKPNIMLPSEMRGNSIENLNNTIKKIRPKSVSKKRK